MDRRFGTWSQLSLAHLLISYGFFFVNVERIAHTAHCHDDADLPSRALQSLETHSL